VFVGSFPSGWLISSFHRIGRFITSSYFGAPNFQRERKGKGIFKKSTSKWGKNSQIIRRHSLIAVKNDKKRSGSGFDSLNKLYLCPPFPNHC